MAENEQKQGLYDARNEHDACGIGFYANMDNLRSHDIVIKSLEMLRRLDHRGGIGADGMTGDGAGIMTEIPFKFFKQQTELDLPEEGSYAVGFCSLMNQLKVQDMKQYLRHISKARGFV